MESTREVTTGAGAQPPQPTEDKKSRVQIFVVNEAEADSCDFWVGLFAKGPHSPNHLFYKNSLMEVFDTASKEGLAEVVPVMLSDTTGNKSKFIYLLPQLGDNALEDDEWVRNVLQAIQACRPKTVGIYLSPKAVKQKDKSEASLQRILDEIIEQSEVNNIALFPGDYGTNSVLNVALAIKNKKDKEIMVYH